MKHLEDALRILERANGKDHRFVALIVNNLSYVYGRLGKGKRSQQYAERSLTKFKTRTAIDNLGIVAQRMGIVGNERRP